MPKLISGKEAMKILCRSFGFSFISQKGSHVKLAKQVDGNTITTIVPMHKELARGTLKGVLELAKVEEKEFWDQA